MTVLTTADDGRALLPRRSELAAAAGAEQIPPVVAAAVDAAPVAALAAPVDLEALAARVAELSGARSGTSGHPLSRFSSLSDFARAARLGDADALAAFAIADQITTDNPGVIPPAWMSEVHGIVNRGARAIAALGGPASIGDSGMALAWPYFDGDLSTIVGAQAAEKTDVTSVKVPLKKGGSDLATYAGGSDVSWQLIERSAPSYLDAYLRILTAAYAVVTDAAFAAALAAGTGRLAVPGAPDTTTAAKFAAQVFEASLIVDDVTGAPASVILASRDVFAKLGGLQELWPNRYGTQNTKGTADAASLRVEVSGLEVTYVPGLPAAHAVVTNEQAIRWHGTGPLFASADDVLKLGQDTVVWGMGAAATYAPGGVVVMKAAAR
jgi:hypothetical protein